MINCSIFSGSRANDASGNSRNRYARHENSPNNSLQHGQSGAATSRDGQRRRTDLQVLHPSSSGLLSYTNVLVDIGI